MTLLFLDSFDHYDTAGLSDKGYSQSGGEHNILVGGGRNGSGALRASGFLSGSKITKTITDSDTVIIGVALNFNAKFQREAIVVLNTAGQQLAVLSTRNNGGFRIVSGGITQTTGGNQHTVGTYSHLQLKYTKGTGSNSFCEVKLNDSIILTITTGNETEQGSAIQLVEMPSGSDISLAADLYVMNGLGSVNNDYSGDLVVQLVLPNGNGAEVEFSGSSGSDNFTHIDEKPADDDVTWNQSDVILDRDIFDVPTPSGSSTIFGVQTNVLARKTDAGTVKVDVITEKPAGTGEKINAAAVLLADSYAFALAINELDPDDNSTWTSGKISSTDWGYKVNDIIT